MAAGISIMEGNISFFWRLVDAGVSLDSLISLRSSRHYGRDARDTMTLGALAMLSLVRQRLGANRDADSDRHQMADAWAAHDCETVLRSILSLLERGVELSENIAKPGTPRVEHYSLGASAVVTAAESGHWDIVDRLCGQLVLEFGGSWTGSRQLGAPSTLSSVVLAHLCRSRKLTQRGHS